MVTKKSAPKSQKKSAPKSQKKSAPKSVPFAVINQGAGNQSWDGSPVTLFPSQSARMPQTPDRTVIFAYQNMTTLPIPGSLALTSGGFPPEFLNAPALTNQPSFLTNNFQGNNLGVTNISLPGQPLPILVQLIGRGLPGLTPVPLPSDATPVSLAPGQAAQGTVQSFWMQLILQATSSQLAVFILMGGPGDNAYVIALNATQDAGPGTANQNVPPPAGYYATTASGVYTFQFNWSKSIIFVVNMSQRTERPGQVFLRQI